MTKVLLHGELGVRFGKTHRLEVTSAEEALRGIDTNSRGEFLKHISTLLKNKKFNYKIVVDNYQIADLADYTILKSNLNENSEIEIIPTFSGDDPATLFGQIIIGLIVGTTLQVLAMVLAPSPKLSLGQGESGSGAQKESFLFSGRDSPVKQGNPVPVGYGRMLVPSIPISAEYVYRNKLLGGGGVVLNS